MGSACQLSSRKICLLLMVACIGAEVYELLGNYLLYELSKLYQEKDIGLYRDDGIADFKNESGPESTNSKVNSIYISGEQVENNHPL